VLLFENAGADQLRRRVSLFEALPFKCIFVDHQELSYYRKPCIAGFGKNPDKKGLYPRLDSGRSLEQQALEQMQTPT